MADNNLTYTLTINSKTGEANIKRLQSSVEQTTRKMSGLRDALSSFGKVAMGIDYARQAFNAVKGAVDQCYESHLAQSVAETKLAAVMRNTMDASREEFQSILDLAAAQQKLGVIGDEVQLAGAQELSTYLEKKESLEKLMPVMNDMLAQQYGMNASQESAAQIATMMGKVMDGQVGALSRYGYKFTEAQEKILKFGTEEQRAATLAEVVSESVGGVNAALAQTPEGALKKHSNTVGDLHEKIGELYAKIKTAMLPTMEKVTEKTEKIVDWLHKNVDAIIGLIKILGGLAVAIGLVITMVKLWTAAQAILNVILGMNPIVLIIAGCVALIAIITAIILTTEGWGDTFSAVWEYIKLTGNQAVAYFKLLGLHIKDTFVSAFDAILKKWLEVKSHWSSDAKNELKQLQENQKRRIDEIAKARNELNKISDEKSALKVWNVHFKKSEGNSGGNVMDALFANVNKGNGSNKPEPKTASATSAVATGGTRNTVVNIHMGKMFDNMVFNGGVRENARDIENQFREMLLRVLYSAQMS